MTAIVFDVGNVLLDWDPRVLLDRLLADRAAVDRFLAEIDFATWNLSLDAGRDWGEAVVTAGGAAPQHADTLTAFRTRWLETITGEVPGSVAILERLAKAGRPLYAITNYSAEKWAESLPRFPFLRTAFRDVVVSGHERVTKPDPRIFRILLDRSNLAPESCVFIDDNPANVAAAAELGMDAIRFTDAPALEAALAERGLMP